MLNRAISKPLEQLILGRESVVAVKDDKRFMALSGETEEFTAQVIYPIICEGDAIGSVAILSKEPRVRMGDVEQKLAATSAGFLGRQMEG